MESSNRYSRQILFAPIGEAGQEQIRAASVCIAGCGALGSFQAEALTRAGIGRIRIIDRDYVDFTNLQRQWLFDEEDARSETPKAIAAAKRLRVLNQEVLVEPLVSDLTPSNAEELLGGCTIILDGTDNFETRYLLNDISVRHGVPWIYGAAVGSYGVVMAAVPGRGPCLSCIYPEPPSGLQPTCDVDGVISPATATVGAWQVAAAMKLIVGWPDFKCQIRTFDLWHGRSGEMWADEADPECRTCQRREFRYLDGQRRAPVSLCGRNAVQIHEHSRPIDLQEMARRLRPLGSVRVNEFALRFSIPRYDLTLFPDGRAIVKGTTEVGVARSIYAQYVGN